MGDLNISIGGPKDQSQQNIKFDVAAQQSDEHSGEAQVDCPAEKDDSLQVWMRKLEYLRQQEAIVSNPAQRFELRWQIEQAESRIAELAAARL